MFLPPLRMCVCNLCRSSWIGARDRGRDIDASMGQGLNGETASSGICSREGCRLERRVLQTCPMCRAHDLAS